jgi:hypothetical protein
MQALSHSGQINLFYPDRKIICQTLKQVSSYFQKAFNIKSLGSVNFIWSNVSYLIAISFRFNIESIHYSEVPVYWPNSRVFVLFLTFKFVKFRRNFFIKLCHDIWEAFITLNSIILLNPSEIQTCFVALYLYVEKHMESLIEIFSKLFLQVFSEDFRFVCPVIISILVFVVIIHPI